MPINPRSFKIQTQLRKIEKAKTKTKKISLLLFFFFNDEMVCKRGGSKCQRKSLRPFHNSRKADFGKQFSQDQNCH